MLETADCVSLTVRAPGRPPQAAEVVCCRCEVDKLPAGGISAHRPAHVMFECDTSVRGFSRSPPPLERRLQRRFQRGECAEGAALRGTHRRRGGTGPVYLGIAAPQGLRPAR